jgi:uncharacterized protein (DUF2236 family)
MNNIDEKQVGGEHYKAENPEQQHWNAMVEMDANYFQGVITKYLDRYPFKNGLQDLEKARHYAEKYATCRYFPVYSHAGVEHKLKSYLAKFNDREWERAAIVAVFQNDMNEVIRIIDILVNEKYKEVS